MVIPRDSLGHASELVQQGRLPEAREAIGQFLARAPAHAEALHLAGMIELMSGAPAAALPFLRRCVEVAPSVPFAWSNLGVAFNATGDFTNALSCFQKTLELQPGSATALKNQGMALRRLGRHDDAMASYRRALQRTPNDIELHREAAHLLVETGRPSEALARYDRALLVAPSDPHLHSDRGVALESLGRRDEAVQAYGRAVDIDPAYVEALENRGAAFGEMRRFAEALGDFERVEALAPGRRHNAGHRLQARLGLCDWDGLDRLVEGIAAGLAAGRAESQPFPLCYVAVAPPLRRACAELFARDTLGAAASRRSALPAYSHQKIRVGYFSADLRDHPVGHLLAPLIESHDRARVEAVAFSWGPDTGDPVRRRLERAFDRFEDVRAETSAGIAALARRLEIDVAVDLMGHTAGARTALFAHGAAPVQAQFMGYPGTLGVECIDYLVTDATTVPDEHRAHYTEKIAHLPGPALVADGEREIAATPDRARLGLPSNAFVFACFCARAKITPDAFETWMRIVDATPHSVLWLADPGEPAARNLRAEAARRGVSPERLVFAARVPALAEHLARLGAADLFLDTFHYAGHVTTSDALYAGVPVIALRGDAFPARVSMSLLEATGLAELAAESPAQYEALARRLALDPASLRALRERLVAGRATHPAFEVPRLARGLEALYARMVERHRAGLAPDHIHP